MKTVFVLAACLSSLVASAQEYYLDLRRQRLAVPNRTVAVEQVLDGRRGNLPTGFTYRGLSSGRLCPFFSGASRGPN